MLLRRGVTPHWRMGTLRCLHPVTFMRLGPRRLETTEMYTTLTSRAVWKQHCKPIRSNVRAPEPVIMRKPNASRSPIPWISSVSVPSKDPTHIVDPIPLRGGDIQGRTSHISGRNTGPRQSARSTVISGTDLVHWCGIPRRRIARPVCTHFMLCAVNPTGI